MNIFLTGGTGYLGSKIAHALVSSGHSVYFLVRRTSNLSRIIDFVTNDNVFVDEGSDLKNVLSSAKIDIVIHCATHYGRNDTDPMSTIASNLLLPLRLLDAASRTAVKCFISTGTMLDKRVNYYSLSKSQFDEWMLHYSAKIRCINMLLEHFYGPGDDPTKFVTSMLSKLKDQVEKIDLTLGMQKRDFIFIDDVVEAFLLVVSKADALDSLTVMQVGSGESISIREFMTEAKKIAKNEVTELSFGAIPYRDNEVMNSNVDTTLLNSLGWAAKTSLLVGLQKTIWG